MWWKYIGLGLHEVYLNESGISGMKACSAFTRKDEGAEGL
jgi:hypothetical protein